MITIFIRALLLYVLMISAIRLMGKRQLGQFEPYELAMTLLIADILATPMSDVSTPLLHGILPVMAMISIHAAITILSIKSDKARSLISGKPSVIISDGVIDYKELNRLSLSLSDLLEGIREFGIMNPWDVQYAIMEANGTITAFEKSNKRTPVNEELGLTSVNTVFPVSLIMDGKIQYNNLKSAGISEKQLYKAVKDSSHTIKEILLATVDTGNRIVFETRSGQLASAGIPKEESA